MGSYEIDAQLTDWAQACVRRAAEVELAAATEGAEGVEEGAVEDTVGAAGAAGAAPRSTAAVRAEQWSALGAAVRVATCDAVERTVTLRSPPHTRVGQLLQPLTPGGGATERVLPLAWGRVGSTLFLPLPRGGPRMLRALTRT